MLKAGLEVSGWDPVPAEAQVRAPASIWPWRHPVLGSTAPTTAPHRIGNVLVEMGVMKREDVTWPAIRDWLKRNPQKARDVMRKNERYIFFKDTKSAAPSGAEGVALTAQRSLAVDTAFTPFGTPIWIDTSRPLIGKPGATEIYRRLMIAQDSGAAIKGPARSDVYGAGAQASNGPAAWSAAEAIVLGPTRAKRARRSGAFEWKRQ